jgi:hypothetical protein
MPPCTVNISIQRCGFIVTSLPRQDTGQSRPHFIVVRSAFEIVTVKMLCSTKLFGVLCRHGGRQDVVPRRLDGQRAFLARSLSHQAF